VNRKKYIDRTTDSDKARLKPMEVTGFVWGWGKKKS